MYGEVKLTTAKGETQTVPMLATASTPIRFKMIFGKDLMSGIVSNGEFDMDFVSKLAFLMTKQAAKVDLRTLDMDQYIDWLDDFDSMAFMESAQDVFNIYVRSRNNTSKAKK